jgi:hypothetical protein
MISEYRGVPLPWYGLARLVRNGPLVPIALVVEQTTEEPDNPENLMDRSPHIVGTIAGREAPVEKVWDLVRLSDSPRGRPITAQEYVYQVSLCKYVSEFSREDPLAKPRARVDLLTAPLPFVEC